MPDLVQLPSGAIAPLEVPSLPLLLAAGGDLMAIAAASFAHEEVEVEELLDSDLYFVASWALVAFAASEDGLELAIVSDAWRRPPAEVIGLADLPLAWVLEHDLYLRLAAAQTGAGAQDAEPAGGGVRFTTGGPAAAG